MRSPATCALIVALAVIALAAAFDALRGDARKLQPASVAALSAPRLACPQAVPAMFLGEGGARPCARAKPRRLGA